MGPGREEKKLFNTNNTFPFKNRANEVKISFVKSISFHLQNHSKLLVCQKLRVDGLKTNFKGCLANFSHREDRYFEH